MRKTITLCLLLCLTAGASAQVITTPSGKNVDACKYVGESQQEYTYRLPKWYTYFNWGICGGRYYKRVLSGGYSRSGIETKFDNYGENLDGHGSDWWVSVERLYRAGNTYFGPGVIFGGANANSSWGIYGRLRYEYPIGTVGIHAFASGALGIRHLGGEGPNGCDYYLSYNSYTYHADELNGNIGTTHSSFNYMQELSKNPKTGFMPFFDFGLGILFDMRNFVNPPKQSLSRYGLAISYHIRPMYCLNHLLNLDDHKAEIDNIVNNYPHTTILHFDETVTSTLYHGVEFSFRF